MTATYENEHVPSTASTETNNHGHLDEAHEKPIEDGFTPNDQTSDHTDTLEKKMQSSENAEKNSIENGSGEPEYPSNLKAALIVASLFMAVFLVALDQTIIGTAIPKITDQFHSVQDVGWYGSAYFLTSTALQPTYGRIYKIFNVRDRR